MYELRLEPGPNLIRKAYKVDEVDENITLRTLEFLNQPVEIAPGVTLSDIFRLLDHPVLESIYHLDFATDFLEEARKGPLPNLRLVSSETEDPEDAIEYLELYQVWDIDNETGGISDSYKLDFHGIGVVRTKDSDDGVWKANQRTHWALDGSNVRSLLDLPVQWNPTVYVTRDYNVFGVKNPPPYDHALRKTAKLRVERVSLNQIFHGILWELSFHGSPRDAAAFREELTRRVRDTDNFVPLEDFLTELRKDE